MMPSTKPFADRVAIITGAGSGLGRAHALLLSQLGAAVVVNDLGTSAQGVGAAHSAADDVVKEIRDAGGQAVASYQSVTSAQGGVEIVQAALDNFGRVDVLINNAGTQRPGLLDVVSDEAYTAMIDVHLKGAFYVTKPAFAQMKAQGYGRILFTASSAGLFGGEMMAGYASGKTGLIGLMNTASIEGAPHGIRCNLLLPSSETRMSDDSMPFIAKILAIASRMGSERLSARSPSYVSPLVAYLVSEACQSTHAIYSSVFGRHARVFLGVGPGWLSPAQAPATFEDVAAHFSQIAATTPFTLPEHLVDEFEGLANMVAGAASS